MRIERYFGITSEAEIKEFSKEFYVKYINSKRSITYPYLLHVSSFKSSKTLHIALIIQEPFYTLDLGKIPKKDYKAVELLREAFCQLEVILQKTRRLENLIQVYLKTDYIDLEIEL